VRARGGAGQRLHADEGTTAGKPTPSLYVESLPRRYPVLRMPRPVPLPFDRGDGRKTSPRVNGERTVGAFVRKGSLSGMTHVRAGLASFAVVASRVHRRPAPPRTRTRRLRPSRTATAWSSSDRRSSRPAASTPPSPKTYVVTTLPPLNVLPFFPVHYGGAADAVSGGAGGPHRVSALYRDV